MNWKRFIICLLFGWLGVHKFMEKKTGMGLLYLFTFGLFGIGWIVDCILYFPSKTSKSNDKKILPWVLSVLAILFALVFLPSFSSLLFLVAAALIIPIDPWQDKIRGLLKGKIRPIAAGVMAAIALFTVPTAKTPENPEIPIESPSVVTMTETATEMSTNMPEEKSAATVLPSETTAVEPTVKSTTKPTESMGTEEATPSASAALSEKPKETETVQKTEEPVISEEAQKTETPEEKGREYILNTNTGKFHYPSCSSVKDIKESNKKVFNGTRDEVIDEGYEPCGKCHP